MESLVLGAPPISSQLLTITSRKSFSRSKTLGTSLSAHSVSSLLISTTIPPPTCCIIVSLFLSFHFQFFLKKKNITRRSPRNKQKGPPRAPVSPTPTKKDRFEDDDASVKIEIDESF
ncbi:hypothetical protein I3760_09G207300 [Carya illinoinensis]|uniref:Uncharacterized protein n=1 Tax=Carya illinoinensis TaxID=32201 RepID=A0A8T1PPD9_CARIL|nr:hypothetical protein I3760_09G207300 [Carya illinoinensis]KAG6643381.1 hypothetical protein CIPAW_09G207700 [Carya illinoinensis]